MGQRMISIMWSNSLHCIHRAANQQWIKSQRTNQPQDQRKETRTANQLPSYNLELTGMLVGLRNIYMKWSGVGDEFEWTAM